MQVPVWVFLGLMIGGGSVASSYIHVAFHGTFSWLQTSLAFFCITNFVIALWEIVLWFKLNYIKQLYSRYKDTYKGRELQAAVDMFAMKLSVGTALSPSLWAEIWARYSLFDPSYSDQTSFGFYVDIGNGFTTWFPSLLFVYAMTAGPLIKEVSVAGGLLRPKIVGMLGLLSFWQELYGTVLYFTSFVVNKRYKPLTVTDVVLFVGCTNGLWLIMPALGMYASIQLIMQDSYAIFL
eukprot:g26022.t1